HHNCALNAVALSPDGKMVVSGGQSHNVYLWDAGSGQGPATLSGFPADISSLAFSPQGDRLAIASFNDLQLIDYEPPTTFRRRATLLKEQYYIAALAFSADGKHLAACSRSKGIHVWDLDTLQRKTAPGTLPEDLTAI